MMVVVEVGLVRFAGQHSLAWSRSVVRDQKSVLSDDWENEVLTWEGTDSSAVQAF
jgi:hypothetical protein